jgi:hypothetical protein
VAKSPTIRPTMGKKPTGWLTLEVNGCLLVGEKVDGRWQFECDELPQIPRKFNGSKWLDRVLEAFFQESL